MVVWGPLGIATGAVRLWDDEAVVFNSLSGQTHILNALAAEALLLLLERPRSEAELSTELLAAADAVSSLEWIGAFTAMIRELDRLGLISVVER